MPEFHIYGLPNREIIYVGSDRYRGHNLIEVDQQLMSIKGNLDLDNHYLTFGYETDSSSIINRSHGTCITFFLANNGSTRAT